MDERLLSLGLLGLAQLELGVFGYCRLLESVGEVFGGCGEICL